MSETLRITVCGDGSLSGVWDDSMAELVEAAASVKCRRASHVEMDEDGLWVADMSPAGGPKLPGCRRRKDALAAERAWLLRNPIY